MSDLTDRLNKIQARADAATTETWIKVEAGDPEIVVKGTEGYSIDGSDRAVAEVMHFREDRAFITHARTDVLALLAALRAVLDVIGPHYATMLRREAKFGRTRSSCCCEQCRAVQAIADALGVKL